MKNTTRLVVAAGLLSLSGLAHAEAAANASLTFNFSALKYSTVSTKTKPDGGTESTVKEGALATSNLQDSYAEITFGNFNFYCSPFNATHTVQASFMVVPDFVEVGLNLGLNTDTVDKPKHTSNDTTAGLFGWVYPKVGSMTSELGLEVDSITNKSSSDETVAGAAVTTKKESSGLKETLTANLVVPLAKNFSYVAGIYYANGGTTTTQPAKGKEQTGEFGVNIASFRVTVE